MYKVLVWGTGRRFCQLSNLLRFYTQERAFCIIGITSNEDFYTSVNGYPFIPKEKIGETEFDYIIVTNEDYHSVVKEAEILYGSQIQEKMIAGRVLQLPDFDFDKYIKIKKHVPSIISPNCFAGFLYHNLGLPFLSPTINMFWYEEDYYELLTDLRRYMEKPLELQEMIWDEEQKREYPICSVGGCRAYMQHYKTYEEAREKWGQRIKRIDYDNLLIVGIASNKDNAERFCALPYEHKICFTNFKMKDCIDVTNIYEHFYKGRNETVLGGIGKILNDSAWGQFNLYNLFDILNTGDEENE